MQRSCVAFKCTERFKKGTGITFHKFPNKENVKIRWVNATRRENWKPKNSSFLCSKHFEADCFDRTGQNVRLRENSVPTLFDFPTHLQKKVSARRIVPTRRALEVNFPQNQEEECQQSVAETNTLEEHSYAVLSPTKLKRKLDCVVDKLEKGHKKIKVMHTTNARLKKKAARLETVLEDLKSKYLLGAGEIEELSSEFSGVSSHLFKRQWKKIHGGDNTPYSDALKTFAITSHFYSPRAYTYIRKEFDLTLPDPSTLRRWYSNVKCNPGFTTVSMDAVCKKAQEAKQGGHELLFNLAIDEMSIRKHLDLVGDSSIGLVDIGTGMETDSRPEATEVLVFLLVCINSPLKVPIAYFLINGLDANKQATIVNQGLHMLHQRQINVVSMTFDGTAVNFSFFSLLGADLQFNTMQVSFLHPADQQKKVNVILDPSHMIKLVRNTLADKEVIYDLHSQEINWKYIKEFHEIQITEGLHLANRFGIQHIDWQKQKMKVKLAVQTLSTSVADAGLDCIGVFFTSLLLGNSHWINQLSSSW